MVSWVEHNLLVVLWIVDLDEIVVIGEMAPTQTHLSLSKADFWNEGETEKPMHIHYTVYWKTYPQRTFMPTAIWKLKRKHNIIANDVLFVLPRWNIHSKLNQNQSASQP